MKVITAGLISLSLLVSAFAEGNFGPAWVEGHHYEVKDGQLVDLGPTASPSPSPAPTSTPTSAPPTINIYNNVTTQTRQVAPAVAPAVVAPAPAPVAHD